eukprot:2265138-Ditylum_brightwellii.AAC.1
MGVIPSKTLATSLQSLETFSNIGPILSMGVLCASNKLLTAMISTLDILPSSAIMGVSSTSDRRIFGQ